MIAEGMAAALLADADLAAVMASLAGGSAASAANVIPDELLPQGAQPPAVLIVEGEGDDVLGLRGASALEWVDVELACQARSRRDAGRLRVAVRQAVQAQLPGRQFGVFAVQKFHGAGRSARHDPPAHGEGPGTYVASQRYRVWLTKPDGM